MKRTLKLLMAAFLCVIVASCGSGNKPTPEQVAQKLDSKEALTEADYTTMIEYCGSYAEKAQVFFNIINTQTSDSTAAYITAAQDMANLRAENPYVDIFRSAIYAADDSEIGADNVKLVKQYEQYEAFPLPDGSGPDLQQPGVIGDIEEMPDTTGTGVISQGIGVAVDDKK